MPLKPSLFTNVYKPDVISCLADLSNDEVFTPPSVANKMLDMLPQELFRDPNTKFLDPACKSGVFLREIAKRLIAGLAGKIPDLQKRCDWIFHNQLYGIAITELTSLLSRRSVYCSKYPNSPFSITKFDDIQGNILYHKVKHTWKKGSCIYCGTAERGELNDISREGMESHAYEFIHTLNPREIFNMKFDVIVSNPPYQLGDSGAFASASPIYQKFVDQAKKLNPRYMTMIIPSRWFAGGKGLDDFRNEMLKDDRIRVLHDYQMGSDCFPGTRIAGGVCYFLWNRDHRGECEVFNHDGDTVTSRMTRPLLEDGADTFIRMNEAIPILRKVRAFKESSFSALVSPRKPFGLTSDFFADPSKYNLPQVSDEKGQIRIVGTYKYKTVWKYANKDYPFPNGSEKVWKYKVFVSQVLDAGFDWTRERLSPFLGLPGDACTETFVTVGSYDDKETAENVISYMNTKFFHLLMFLKKVSHHVTAKVYEYIPVQDFSHPWSDKMLYEKYHLTDTDINFIETHIREPWTEDEIKHKLNIVDGADK